MTAPRRGAWLLATAIWIPAVIIGLLMAPMVLTSRSFGQDWTLHLWAIRQQQWNIEAMGHPGLFVSARPLGAFYPVFAFVGSGIYSVGGYLAIVLGDRPILAYKLLFFFGLCIAYGGFTWLAWQFGRRGWRSQVPGAVLVTGAYFVTDMVGRGDFGEFVAIASIPFVIASVCAVVRAPNKGRLAHRLAVVLGVFVLTGSHNITLLWGGVFLAVLAVAVLIAWGPTWRRPLPWKRVGHVVGLAAIGVGLNAWYLFPDLAYGFDTAVAKRSQRLRPKLVHVHLPMVFNPLRPADHVFGLSADVRLAFPVLFFAWAIVVAALWWRAGDWVARRLFIVLFFLALVFARLVVVRATWKRLPRILYNVQFTYRIDAYVLLATALLVLIALAWQATAGTWPRRVTTALLGLIVAFNVGAATWQVWNVKSTYSHNGFQIATGSSFNSKVVRSHYVIPPSWYDRDDFRDFSSRVVTVRDARTMTMPLDRVHGSSFSGMVAVPDGTAPFATNISAGPRFVRMRGIRAVGRTPDGSIVAVRDRGVAADGPVAVTIEPAHATAQQSGAVVSVLSLVALVGVIVWPARRLRSRGAR